MVDHHRSSPLVSGRAGTPEPSQTKFLQLGAVTICQAAPIPRPLGLATCWQISSLRIREKRTGLHSGKRIGWGKYSEKGGNRQNHP